MIRRPGSTLSLATGLVSIALCLACGQKPAQLKIDGELPKEVYGALPIRLPKAVVLDDKGQPLEKQPEIKIESKPSEVAMVQDQQLVPIKDGKAEIRYTVPGTELRAVHNVVVSLIDRVELACPEDGCELSTGQKVEMKAAFFQGKQKLDSVTAHWESSNPAVVEVDAMGKVEAKSGGEAVITVRVGVFEAKATLNVVGTGLPDRVKLVCRKENVNVFDEAGGCVIKMGVPVDMELSATAGGAPVRVPQLEWSSSEPGLVEVHQGRRAEVVGKALGKTTLTGKFDTLETSLQVEVVPPACSDSNVESFRQPMGKRDSIALVCKMEEAQTCFNHYVDKKKPQQAHIDMALERCCCEVREKPPVEEAAAPSDGE